MTNYEKFIKELTPNRLNMICSPEVKCQRKCPVCTTQGLASCGADSTYECRERFQEWAEAELTDGRYTPIPDHAGYDCAEEEERDQWEEESREARMEFDSPKDDEEARLFEEQASYAREAMKEMFG